MLAARVLNSGLIKAVTCAGDGKGKVTSIAIAKTNVSTERRDFFIWQFSFRVINFDPATSLAVPVRRR
jgi:hypothetical protein